MNHNKDIERLIQEANRQARASTAQSFTNQPIKNAPPVRRRLVGVQKDVLRIVGKLIIGWACLALFFVVLQDPLARIGIVGLGLLYTFLLIF